MGKKKKIKKKNLELYHSIGKSVETEPSRTARKSSLDSGLQCRTTMRRCPRRKVDNAAKVFHLRKTGEKERKKERKKRGGRRKKKTREREEKRKTEKRRRRKVDLWNLCFRQLVLFLKEPWEKASHLGEQGLQDSENVYLLSLCLSFARSLDSALDLKGCSCEGGKKEGRKGKKEKGTKREKRREEAREEEKDKQRFFYQRGESWLCVWWKSCQERVKKLIIYVNDRSNRIVAPCLNAWILAKFQSTLASDWKSAINFEWKRKEEKERERKREKSCVTWVLVVLRMDTEVETLLVTDDLLWRLVFDVIHCARRIFCRFCSGNHVAKDAGICKSTVCGSMEVDAVETVIELIRCSLSTDLEGFLYVYYMINFTNIRIGLFLEKIFNSGYQE